MHNIEFKHLEKPDFVQFLASCSILESERSYSKDHNYIDQKNTKATDSTFLY